MSPPRKPPRATDGRRGKRQRGCFGKDVLGGANGKGMVVCVDMIGAVGDRAAAFYNIVRDRGVDANLMGLFSIRSIPGSTFPLWRRRGQWRRQSTTSTQKKLSIAGYVPLPAISPAWEGEAPDHERVVRMLKESLKVATIANKGPPGMRMFRSM